MRATGVAAGDRLFDITMLRMLKADAARYEEGTTTHSMAIFRVTELQANNEREEDLQKNLELHRERRAMIVEAKARAIESHEKELARLAEEENESFFEGKEIRAAADEAEKSASSTADTAAGTLVYLAEMEQREKIANDKEEEESERKKMRKAPATPTARGTNKETDDDSWGASWGEKGWTGKEERRPETVNVGGRWRETSRTEDLFKGVQGMMDEDIQELTEEHCERKPDSVQWKRVIQGELAFVTYRTPEDANMVVEKIRWKQNPTDWDQHVTARHSWYKQKHHLYEKTNGIIPAFRGDTVTLNVPVLQEAQEAEEAQPVGPAQADSVVPIVVAESTKARSESSNRTKVPPSLSHAPWRHSEGRKRTTTRSRSRRSRSRSIRRSGKGRNRESRLRRWPNLVHIKVEDPDLDKQKVEKPSKHAVPGRGHEQGQRDVSRPSSRHRQHRRWRASSKTTRKGAGGPLGLGRTQVVLGPLASGGPGSPRRLAGGSSWPPSSRLECAGGGCVCLRGGVGGGRRRGRGWEVEGPESTDRNNVREALPAGEATER